PVDDEGVGDDAVERTLVRNARRLPHAIAEHLATAELALVAIDGRVSFHLGDQPRVPEPDAIARRRSVEVRVMTPVDAAAHRYFQLSALSSQLSAFSSQWNS